MNFIDILFSIPLLWFGYKGFNKGLIVGIASLLALVGGIYLAVHFSWYAGDLIEKNIKMSDQYVSLTAFTITFLAVVILVNSIGKIISKMVDQIQLGFVNKLAGGFFGMAKVAFIISVVLYLYSRFDPHMKLIPDETRKESLLYHKIESIAPVTIPRLEAERDRIDAFRPKHDDHKE